MTSDARPLGAAFAISCALHALLFVAVRGSSVELRVLEPGPVLVSLYEVGTEAAGPGPLGAQLGVDPVTSPQPPSPSLAADPLALRPDDGAVAAPTRALLAAVVPSAEVAPKPSEPPPSPRHDDAAGAAPAPKPDADEATRTHAGTGDSQLAAATPEGGAELRGPPEGAPGGTGASAPRWAPTVRVRYEQELFAWLTRFKLYPALARRRGIEGLSVVRVRIDRRGRVVARSLHETAGERALDEAALDMVRRADPFPPIPAAYPDDAYEFLAPIEFRLQEARSR